MNRNQFTLMARFCVLLLALFALPVVVILRHFNFGAASNGGVDRMHDHGSDCTVDYDGYFLNGGSCFYSVDGEGAARLCPEMYSGVRCEKYVVVLLLFWKKTFAVSRLAMRGRLQVKCSVDDSRNLEMRAFCCRKVHTKDRRIPFRNSVLGLVDKYKRRVFLKSLRTR